VQKLKTAGLTLCYDIAGEGNSVDLLLISGIGTQMLWWKDSFVAALADRGFRVIRMDNRDTGLSDGFEKSGIPDIQSMMADRAAGRKLSPPYRLDDMADDCADLLTALGVSAAHVVGGSMGGMIAQLLAILHPERVLSLTSIMSGTGNPALPGAAPQAQAVLLRPRVSPETDREGWLEASVSGALVLGSPGYPEDPADLRAAAEASLDRAYRPTGFLRHYAAVMAAPDRRPLLKDLRLPVTVIHGADDPLVRPEGGRDTAAAIPGAQYHEIPGMGHNIPQALEGHIADLIAETAARA